MSIHVPVLDPVNELEAKNCHLSIFEFETVGADTVTGLLVVAQTGPEVLEFTPALHWPVADCVPAIRNPRLKSKK
jgi:hypothetical protein